MSPRGPLLGPQEVTMSDGRDAEQGDGPNGWVITICIVVILWLFLSTARF